jgi:hypothetical protein
MRKAVLTITLVMGLVISGVARAQGEEFITVEGPDLKSRLEAGVRLGRARSQHTNFWIAYSFNVRPGVGIDLHLPGLDVQGVITGVDSEYETRNAGIFMLFEPQGGAVIEVELQDLDHRSSSVSGHPVYWLGRAGNEESLNLLQKLIESSRSAETSEELAQAVALHDDPRVITVLKSLFRNSSVEEVRIKALSWIGRAPGQLSFLSEVVRNERESPEVRGRAVMIIGRSREAAALPTLQSLYRSITNREVKQRIIDAALKNDDREHAINFLTKIAQSDPDFELREHAQTRLRRKAGRRLDQ